MLVNKYLLPMTNQKGTDMVDPSKLFDDMKTWILQLPGVSQANHRFGGSEFQVEGLEFMHHHGPSLLDIRLSNNDQATALKNGIAIPHRFAPQAGWVSFRVEKAEDLGSDKDLIQLVYESAKTNMGSSQNESPNEAWLSLVRVKLITL